MYLRSFNGRRVSTTAGSILSAALILLVVGGLVTSCADGPTQVATTTGDASTLNSTIVRAEINHVEVVDKTTLRTPVTVCGDIGADGGSITTGRVTLTVPAGALSSTVNICVEESDLLLLIADFTPAGLAFAEPVFLDWNLEGTTAANNASGVTTYWYNPATFMWESQEMDSPPSSNTARAQIDHFSRYAEDVGG